MESIVKKVLSGAVALIISLNLWGCSANRFDEEKIGRDMEEILTQLFHAVQDGDEETFQTFFADQIVELPDFEEGCNYVFEKYQGNVLSIKCDYPMGTGDHIVPGEQICYAFTTFNIITSENEYIVYVQFYTQYESKYPDDPYKIRKFSLLAKQDDGTLEDDGFGFSQRYGIYYPGWIDEEMT